MTAVRSGIRGEGERERKRDVWISVRGTTPSLSRSLRDVATTQTKPPQPPPPPKHKILGMRTGVDHSQNTPTHQPTEPEDSDGYRKLVVRHAQDLELLQVGKAGRECGDDIVMLLKADVAGRAKPQLRGKKG